MFQAPWTTAIYGSRRRRRRAAFSTKCSRPGRTLCSTGTRDQNVVFAQVGSSSALADSWGDTMLLRKCRRDCLELCTGSMYCTECKILESVFYCQWVHIGHILTLCHFDCSTTTSCGWHGTCCFFPNTLAESCIKGRKSGVKYQKVAKS